MLTAAVPSTLLPRALAESLVAAATDSPGQGANVVQELDAAGGLHWERSSQLGEVIALGDLRSAVTGLDASRRARIDAVLALADFPHVTIGPAAAQLDGALGPRDLGGVRAVLQQHGLDVVGVSDGISRDVYRVPASFLEHGSAAELARTAVSQLSDASPVAKVPPMHPQDAPAGPLAGRVSALRGTLGRATSAAWGHYVKLPVAGRIGVPAGVLAAAVGTTLLALRGSGGGASSAPDAPDGAGAGPEAAPPSAPSSTSAPVSPSAPAAKTADEVTRAKLVQTALDLVGTDDLDSNGTLNTKVRDMKAGVVAGDPDNPRAAWELAFVTHVAAAAGTPIGPDGRGTATVNDLRVWAEKVGRFRAPDDAAARAGAGNLVLLERKDTHGLTFHDIGVVAPARDGKGLVVIAGNRMAGKTVDVGGHPVYVGTVGTVTSDPIPFDATIERDGMRIEGFIDTVSPAKAPPAPAPAPAPAPPPPDPKVEESRKRAEIVARAQDMVGVAEQGPPNRGSQVDAFWKSAGDQPLADVDRLWCAAFTSWLYNEQHMPFYDRDGDVSTIHIRKWAVDNGVWHGANDGYTPQPGDLVGFGAGEAINHIGIVKSYDPATGALKTIEGNVTPWDRPAAREGVNESERSLTDGYTIGFVNVFDYYAKHPEGPQ